MSDKFRKAITEREFVITWEMVPGRGAVEDHQEKEIGEAKRVYDSGPVHAVSITDNPGGNPAILSDSVGEELKNAGVDTLVHFTCKDRSRNQIAAQLYSLERKGVHNLLVMSGDYPMSGWKGRSRPAFDLDPIQVLQMIRDMNEGLEVSTSHGPVTEKPAIFFAGAVVNPFKWTEGEVVPQYYKMEKKIAAGAEYLITQLGYDVRKMHEVMLYLKERNYDIPVLANIYVLSAGVARPALASVHRPVRPFRIDSSSDSANCRV